jgi:hypothetical protein
MEISSGTVTKRSTSSGERPGLGGDLHLHVGHVGEGIHRQLARRVEAEGEQDHRHHDHHQPLLEGRSNKGCDHALLQFLALALGIQMESPAATMRSPALRPSSTGRWPPPSGPRRTGVRR